LAEGGVDFILLETMNTVREASVACAVAKATGKEVVVSFICDAKGRLLSGESLQDAVRTVSEQHPVAFSINCVSPRQVKPSLDALKSVTHLPFAVYGNVGLPESDKHGWEFTHNVSEEEYARFAVEWVSDGASIVGGCCGTTPAYIRDVASRCKIVR
jgi:S-methylmethionine-dependent homocysteine/selenocysteine methylase